ncbi:hypothetical protein NIES2109_59670 (plasmid) [Nostoc sp. HK-01]|nr:hypothetical protein NIES2109_59670 [Nostoc sp. HK-01]
MTFHQLRTGEFFCFSGMTTAKVYRKVNAYYCSQNGFLQKIRPHTSIKRVTSSEVKEYLAKKQSF